MGVSMQDIFGGGGGAQRAIAGSYGEAPSGYRLPAATRLGPVHLRIADLARSLAYYRHTLGLRVLRQEGATAVLGAHVGNDALVVLHEHEGARPAPPRGRLGLFHYAILLPDRPALGRFARHLGAIGAHAGAGDHLVSEALYLHDPDNLGIEVYADRPRDAWQRVGRQLMMATDPVDMAGLVREAGDAPWEGMPLGTVMGHVHLHVGDLRRASDFYSEALGFDRMVWQYPGALFLAAGGYHHHLGTNTWAGSGAAPPSADDAQLLAWTLALPDTGDLAAVVESLARAGHPAESGGEGDALVTRDPWGTQIRLVASPQTGNVG